MAAIARLSRRSFEVDPIEAEAAARAAARAAEKQAEKLKESVVEEKKMPLPNPWNAGVHTAFDELYDVNATSPQPPPRRATETTNTAGASQVKKLTPSKPKSLPVSLGWAPESNFVSLKASPSPSETVEKALAQIPTAAPAPYPVGTPLDQAVTLLGEQLRAERTRTAAAEAKAERLEAELEQVRKAMEKQAAQFAAAIERLSAK